MEKDKIVKYLSKKFEKYTIEVETNKFSSFYSIEDNRVVYDFDNRILVLSNNIWVAIKMKLKIYKDKELSDFLSPILTDILGLPIKGICIFGGKTICTGYRLCDYVYLNKI
jgi:hypothetical protein